MVESEHRERLARTFAKLILHNHMRRYIYDFLDKKALKALHHRGHGDEKPDA